MTYSLNNLGVIPPTAGMTPNKNLKIKKAAGAAFFQSLHANVQPQTNQPRREKFPVVVRVRGILRHPLEKTIDEFGRDNWIRTNDPHHVKVVL
jgi:hypothetical protein